MKPKHHIFLDANIYLRFYKLSDADVRELGQLGTLVKSGEVRLYLTEQLRDELHRYRDEAIAESLKSVREQELKPSFPRMPLIRPRNSTHERTSGGGQVVLEEACTDPLESERSRSIDARLQLPEYPHDLLAQRRAYGNGCRRAGLPSAGCGD